MVKPLGRTAARRRAAEDKKEAPSKQYGTYSRENVGCPYQNKDVVPSEALEEALRSRGELCKHGEAWARRMGASDDPEQLKAFTGLWWDLTPQFRSWEVPPDDGKVCKKCKRTHRLGFYRGISYRDRCECNKGARRMADEWKLLGFECAKKGIRERELIIPVLRKKSQSPRPRADSGPRPDVDLGLCAGYVKGGAVGPEPSPPPEQSAVVPPPPPAIEVRTSGRVLEEVPTPDSSRPFAARGFQAFKKKWRERQVLELRAKLARQARPAVAVSTGAFAPGTSQEVISWPTLDGRPAPELPESRRATEAGYDPRTEPLLPGDWRCGVCGQPNIRRRDACAQRRCRGRRPADHTGEDSMQRALRESREADQRREAAEAEELEKALALSRVTTQPDAYNGSLAGPSSYDAADAFGGAFGGAGGGAFSRSGEGFGGGPPAGALGGGALYGGAFSGPSGGAFGNGAFTTAPRDRVSVGARARARREQGAAPAATVGRPGPAAPAAPPPPPSSTGWVALADPGSGRAYYEHAGLGLTQWEAPPGFDGPGQDDADLRAALAASAAARPAPPVVDEDAELRAVLALSARAAAPPVMDDDAELRAVLALSTQEAVAPEPDGDLARALAASLATTRPGERDHRSPTAATVMDIASVLAAAGLSRHLPLFRREEIESVEDLRYLSVDDFVAIGLQRSEAQDLSRMCVAVAV